MNKFLLMLALIVPMLAFTGCGGDDEPETGNNSDTATTANVDMAWIKQNIVGEWIGYQYYNSISGGTWVTNSYFPNNQFLFSSDSKVSIKNFPYSTGDFSYNIYADKGVVYMKIGDRNISIISIDKDKKEMCLYNFAKIRKVQ